MLLCCEAPEMFCGLLQNFTRLSLGGEQGNVDDEFSFLGELFLFYLLLCEKEKEKKQYMNSSPLKKREQHAA